MSEKDGEWRVLRMKLVETELKTSAHPKTWKYDPTQVHVINDYFRRKQIFEFQ